MPKSVRTNCKNGSENNHSAMLMASLGGQEHQQEIPTHQENGNEERDGSKSVASEMEYSNEEEVDEHALQNGGDGELPKKKQKNCLRRNRNKPMFRFGNFQY